MVCSKESENAEQNGHPCSWLAGKCRLTWISLGFPNEQTMFFQTDKTSSAARPFKDTLTKSGV